MDGVETPQAKEISVHWGGGGAVQLEEYGKQKSDYGCNVTRKYDIPADWDDEMIEQFEREIIESIRMQVEPILQIEHDTRMAARAKING